MTLHISETELDADEARVLEAPGSFVMGCLP